MTLPIFSAQAVVKENIKLTINESHKLKVSETKNAVKWVSDNKNIAVVSKFGSVKGIGVGNAEITAKVDSKKYKFSVTVEPKDKDLLLSDDNGIKLSYVNTVNRVVYFRVYNDTDTDITVMDNDLVLDGIRYNGGLYNTKVSARSSQLCEYRCNLYFQDVRTLTGSFSFFDSNNRTKLSEMIFENAVAM
jgi:hypothetical protein